MVCGDVADVILEVVTVVSRSVTCLLEKKFTHNLNIYFNTVGVVYDPGFFMNFKGKEE